MGSLYSIHNSKSIHNLEYPVEIKQNTEKFPLRLYQVEAICELFSEYMNFVKQPNYKPAQKLVCDLTNEQKYIMHYKMFNFYINMGMKVTKIQTINCFKQHPWSKYIDHNTQERTKAKTNFEKDPYKVLNNAFFGKIMGEMKAIEPI